MKFKGYKPEDIDPKEVQRVFGRLAQEPTKLDWAPGDLVEVTDGPFAGMDGIIDSVDLDRQQVKAMIKVFGRETPVVLEFIDIKSVSYPDL